MKVYCAGPLFNDAERGFLDRTAGRFREAGLECFVPHEKELGSLDADAIFRLDYEALSAANALFAWLDGPMVDDGTACEIGRLQRRSEGHGDGVVNLFVAGTLRSAGRICWSLDEALEQLLAWKRELE
jgi:hypothetical protein